MSTTPEEELHAAAAPHMAELERVCEEALQHGQHGVRVDADGIREDPSVPYGVLEVDVTLGQEQ